MASRAWPGSSILAHGARGCARVGVSGPPFPPFSVLKLPVLRISEDSSLLLLNLCDTQLPLKDCLSPYVDFHIQSGVRNLGRCPEEKLESLGWLGVPGGPLSMLALCHSPALCPCLLILEGTGHRESRTGVGPLTGIPSRHGKVIFLS